jgi:hypothetical protein
VARIKKRAAKIVEGRKALGERNRAGFGPKPVVGTVDMVACQTFVPCDILLSQEEPQLLNGHFFGFVARRGN